MIMNLKDVKADVWIRLVVLMLALVNGTLTASGMNPIAVSETELYVVLSNIAMIGAALWNAWKNNSLTASAQQSDILMANLKQAALKIIMDKSNQMLAEHEEAVKSESQV
ncbi:MAG: phage holin [Firmicutes bacterium HGW-Firmicutes-4]|nr:MAG: phage holin [Firmicutes bacterium HGW-Firmicutes-4]